MTETTQIEAPVATESTKATTAAEMVDDTEFVGNKFGIGFWLSALWLVGLAIAALLAPVLPLRPIEGAESIDILNADAAPSFAHPFGTNELGTDLFALCIWGARTSLVVGFASIAFGMLIGGTLGIIAGFRGGAFDKIVSYVFLLLLSFPALILAIFLINSLGRKLIWTTLTIGILSIPAIGRLARAQTLTFAQREFVHASRALGAKNGRVMIREILPNVMMPMAALALLGVAIAIVAEGTLAFIGLGPSGAADSWGKLISVATATDVLREQPWRAFAPILMIFFTVVSLNYLGDQIRSRFDVKDIPL